MDAVTRMDTRTRVKICGITNEADARAAVDAGADALGFIRVPGTPRWVPDHVLVRVAYAVRPFVSSVLVVRCPEDANDHSAGYVQFYEGDDANEPVCARERGDALPFPSAGQYIRAFRVRDESSLREIADYPHRARVAAYLLDAYHESALGGAGQTFDWNLAVQAKQLAGDVPVILAGGLTPENVAEAVAKVRPWAVDVSSGVEAAPGRKDHEKVRAFVRAVRAADDENAQP